MLAGDTDAITGMSHGNAGLWIVVQPDDRSMQSGLIQLDP